MWNLIDIPYMVRQNFSFIILEQIVGILLFSLAILKAFEQYSCK